ncbi:hypothetical protein EVB87_185 [Rhizobium phage RHph_N28_1]|nr:hypothetical protein EVB87_185 [Rhizobium phage RHph_N28_1]QIG74214.1 hypothetical protein EVC07_186 [Rhizobium phage RHph_N42]
MSDFTYTLLFLNPAYRMEIKLPAPAVIGQLITLDGADHKRPYLVELIESRPRKDTIGRLVFYNCLHLRAVTTPVERSICGLSYLCNLIGEEAYHWKEVESKEDD